MGFDEFSETGAERHAPGGGGILVVALGVVGGVILGAGAMLLRGGSTDTSRAKPSAGAVEKSSPATEAAARPTAAPTATNPEVELLQRRIAELEKKKLERRLAELEAELQGSAEPRAEQPAAAPRKPDATESGSAEPKSAADHPAARASGKATFAYWNALNDIIAREAQMRAPPASVTAANAGAFVESRLKAGRYASGAIRALDTAGVDSEAVALGLELIGWYQEEVTLNDRAKSLIGSSDIAARKGAAGNAWRGGEEAHRRRCDEINQKAAELRTRLSQKYALVFPALN